jgi:hypothetical protein
MSMPTYERRYYLDMLIRENTKKNDMMEEKMENMKNSSAKGTRNTKIGGEQLKNKLKSGEIKVD